VPMSYDASGNKFGYDAAGNIAIVPTARGTGYRPGDMVSGFGSTSICTLRVEAVDGGGGILGVRIVTLTPLGFGASAVGGFPTSPAALTTVSGGGSGAQATFGIGHVGPGKNYSFPDYTPQQGFLTWLLLKNPGAGYHAGDVLSLSGFIVVPGILAAPTVTVNTVNGTGGITAITVNSYTANTPLPSTMQELASTGGHGSGATFTGMYTLNPIPAWAAELGRLRTNLNNYLTVVPLDPSKLAISGPWPISGPAWSNHQQWFWFEDTGGTVTLTVGSNFNTGVASAGRFTTATVGVDITENYNGSYYTDQYDTHAGDHPFHRQATLPLLAPGSVYQWDGSKYVTYTAIGHPTQLNVLIGTQKTFSIIIGGTQAVSLVGKFYVLFHVIGGYTQTDTWVSGHPGHINTTVVLDSLDPTTLLTVAAGSTFPGTITKTNVYIGGVGYGVMLEVSVNQTVAPGRYDLVVNINPNGNDVEHNESFENVMLDTNPASSTYNTMIPDGDSYTYTGTYTLKTRLYGAMDEAGSSLGAMYGCASITFTGPFTGPGGLGYYNYSVTGSAGISTVYSTAVAADGIDGVHNLKKINLPDGDPSAGALPTGIYGVIARYTDPPGTANIVGDPGQYWMADGFTGPYHNIFPPSLAWQYYPFPQPVFNWEQIFPGTFGVTASVAGLWTGITAAVSDLRAVTVDLMPWNHARIKNVGMGFSAGTFSYNPMLLGGFNADSLAPSNSYDHTKPCEAQSEPPRWKASTWFEAGFVIVDTTGIGIFKCTSSGYSGSSEPAWNFTVGVTTGDIIGVPASFPFGSTHASCGWTCLKVFKPANSMETAQHRARPIPRYPVYWQTETVPRLKPPVTNMEAEVTNWGCGDQWQDSTYLDGSGATVTQPGWQSGNKAKGWWIYSVSINRIQYGPPTPTVGSTATGIGAGSTTVGAGDTGTGAGGGGSVPAGGGDSAAGVNVTIGCIRSGSFVAFGTYATGQTIQVLWPVFTSDALVYQCSERVDVQAVAVAAGGNGVATGLGQMNQPIAAAFYQDTLKLLGFVQ